MVLDGSHHGASYLCEMANIELEPDQWATQWAKAQKSLEIIRAQNHSSATALLNYEMIAFSYIKYYLNKTGVNGEMVRVTTFLLDLLLKAWNIGRIGLVGRNARKN